MSDFLNITQVSQRYGVSKPTVHAWMHKGIMPASMKIGGIRLWRLTDIEEFERKQVQA